ncbi:MAG: sigma-70 family RNA polymerase sigma factor [Candidatus Colwellbacteria bacterium]
MGKTRQEILIQAYKDYEQSLLKRAFYKISDRDLADDLVQTTFLKTWEYLIKRGEVDQMRAFLFHVLNNLIIDEYRKKKATVSYETLAESGFEVVIDDSESLFNQIDGKTAILMIPLLKDKYRKVISMRFEEEKTIKEIAEATKQLNNTVAVQIYRGVEQLAILCRVDTKKKTKSTA